MKPTTEQIINWGREALNKTGALIPTEWNIELLEAICSAAYEAGRKDENEANKDRIETLYMMYKQASQQRNELAQQQTEALRARLAQPEREWQGLTDEEIKATWSQIWYDLGNGKFAASDDPSRHTTVMFARAIEAKLKEKNI